MHLLLYKTRESCVALHCMCVCIEYILFVFILGPGPLAYKLKPTVGSIDHDPTKPQGVAYSLGISLSGKIFIHKSSFPLY